MAASLNRHTIIGRLGRDPELRYTQGGTAVCNFSVATSRKPKRGEEQTEWHRIVAWGNTAEAAHKYLGKGSQVYVEGESRTRTWEDRNGAKRCTTEVHAWNVIFLGGKGGGGTGGSRGYDADGEYAGGGYTSDVVDDDLPF